MKTEMDAHGPVADAALGRVREGVDRGMTRRRRRTGALIAGGLVLASVGAIGAGLAWPDATDSPYITCFDARVEGAFSTGGGFDMTDPVGFCLDYGDYVDPAGWRFDWNDEYDRDDLVACRLADGVAGVYALGDGDCAAHGTRDWTADDAVLAEQIRDTWRQWHIETFGSDPQPETITTPSQLGA